MFTLSGYEDKMASHQFVWFCHQMSFGIKLVKNQKNPKIPCLDFQRFGNLELQVGDYGMIF